MYNARDERFALWARRFNSFRENQYPREQKVAPPWTPTISLRACARAALENYVSAWRICFFAGRAWQERVVPVGGPPRRGFSRAGFPRRDSAYNDIPLGRKSRRAAKRAMGQTGCAAPRPMSRANRYRRSAPRARRRPPFFRYYTLALLYLYARRLFFVYNIYCTAHTLQVRELTLLSTAERRFS